MVIQQIKKKKEKISVIREKKFDFRPYVQIFPFPDTILKYIKEENRRKEEEKYNRKLDNNIIIQGKANKTKDKKEVKDDDKERITI